MSKPMTADELIAILCRLKTITRPPWKHLNGQVITWREGIAVASCSIDVTRDEQSANAVFIAHAPDDIARLLAEVERLKRVSRYLAERLVLPGPAGRAYYGGEYGAYATKDEAAQSWLDEANREVSNAE